VPINGLLLLLLLLFAKTRALPIVLELSYIDWAALSKSESMLNT
jgi:hypothetical protein